MIDSYLNQTVTHKQKTGFNEFNEPIFAADAQIKCRFMFKRKMVRNREKQELISEATIITTTPIKPDDVIVYNSVIFPVLTVADYAELDGAVLFYEGAL